MSQRERTLELAAVMLWRGRREQGWKLYALPAGFALLLLLITLTALYFPAILTGPTRAGLEAGARAYFGVEPGNTGLAMAFLLLQGPYFLAFFAAYTAASVAQGMVGTETARGGIEVLLSTPYRLREIFLALLMSSLALTMLSWLILAAGTLGIAAAVLAGLRATFDLPLAYLALAVLMPPVMALWANLIALIMALSFPRLVQMRTGTTNVLQLIAMFPALVLIAFTTLRPEVNPLWPALAGLGLAIAGSVGGALVLERRFRPELILET